MRKNLLLFLGLLLIIPNLKAQDEKFKALFMYNFTKYIEWPANKRSGDFVIGIWGKSPIMGELNVIAGKKSVGSQKIVIKEINSLTNCMECQIIYFSEKNTDALKPLIEQLKNKGILIITDKDGCAQTLSCINYIKKDGKQLFEINKKHLDEQGINVNSALLSLGVNVE